MSLPSVDQPKQALDEVFCELRMAYGELESYVAKTFDHLIELDFHPSDQVEAATHDSDEWGAQKEALEMELDALRADKEELAATLSAKEQEIEERQARWDNELDGLRQLVEKRMAEGDAMAQGSDPVVNSVMQTFANLNK